MQLSGINRLMGHLQEATQMPDCHCQGLPVLQTLVSDGKHDFDEDFGASTRLLMLKQHYLKADKIGVCMLLNNVANRRHTLLQCNILLKPAGYSSTLTRLTAATATANLFTKARQGARCEMHTMEHL